MTQPNKILDKSKLGTTDLHAGEVMTLAAYLLEIQRRTNKARYLEIGVFAGGTMRLLKNIVPHARFVGLDLFDDFVMSGDNTHISGTFTQADVQGLLGDDVTLIKGDTNVTLPKLTEKFDLIFIDGNHTYQATWDDFNNALPHLAEDGHIAFHNCSTWIDPDFNYVLRDGGPWQVTEELRRRPDWELVSDVARLRVFRRKKGATH
jgi:predicted O-methyltransferase YrrM